MTSARLIRGWRRADRPPDRICRLAAAEVPLAETWVFRVREGLIVEIREYLSLGEALEAVGVVE
jgi:hypothetical protein